VHLVVKLKLLPDPEQTAALLLVVERFHAAQNFLAGRAFADKSANKYLLQRRYYRALRNDFGLGAQMAVRAIAEVAAAYKRDKGRPPRFRAQGSVVYDARNSRVLGADRVSLATLAGRVVVPFVYGEHQRPLIGRLKGQLDLLHDDRTERWYLYATADVPVPETGAPRDILGVDLGIVNLATDSDGGTHSGTAVEDRRRVYARRRRDLQRTRTKASRRKLRRLSGRQARFQRDTNHRISKRIVAAAEGTGRGIALEDLRGIRGRATVRRRQRARHANWSFFQLRAFIEYKARRAGVPVFHVDPAHTSQTCPACGHVARNNRPTRDAFCCASCGLAGPADHIAAINIARRGMVMVAAAVMPPNERTTNSGFPKVSDGTASPRWWATRGGQAIGTVLAPGTSSAH